MLKVDSAELFYPEFVTEGHVTAVVFRSRIQPDSLVLK
jgi:hypothetical protein